MDSEGNAVVALSIVAAEAIESGDSEEQDDSSDS